MTTFTEGMHDGEFIGELAMGIGYHVDAITLNAGQNRVAGAVLAALEMGTPTATAGVAVSGSGGTVGNGAVGAWTADAGAMPGTWRLVITNPAANAGFYEVRRPDGTIDGIGTVAVAYNGGINGTLADGANDWIEDDYVPVVVAYAGDAVDKEFTEWNPTGTDGSQFVAGILMKNTNATATDTATTALVRGPATVNVNDLTWKSGATAAQILAGRAALLALGIKTA